MLSIVKASQKAQIKIPAVVHIDKTARIQIVSKNKYPLFYELLSKFYEMTSIPVLLNTSLNLRGQPIAGSPWDAMEIFSYSGIDCLAMGSFLYDKDMLSWHQ